MQVTKLQIQNFRCFGQKVFSFEKPIVLIEGANGVGKTTLLEALYYGCYLRSFRTRITRELIFAEEDQRNFFIKIFIKNNDELDQEIQVGFSAQKRIVKINQKSIDSYKQLVDLYRTIALTEDDLNIIKGSPEKRRSFLDQYILLRNPEFIKTLRMYKHIIDSRNALLARGVFEDDLDVWNRQLWQRSCEIQKERTVVLKELAVSVTSLFSESFSTKTSIEFFYKEKSAILSAKSYDEFLSLNSATLAIEKRYKKTLVGAHLDDIEILWEKKSAKNFASRGQQKLLITLIKIAQIYFVEKMNDGAILFLLDDFMTDFDNERQKILISLLTSLRCQLIFTCPLEDSPLKEMLLAQGAQIIFL